MRLFILSLIVSCGLYAQFPTSVATDQDLHVAKDRSSSTLSTTINNSTTTVVVADGTKFIAKELITIESEQMLICSISTNTFTICTGTRGYNGTTAASHTSGVSVLGNVTASHHNVLKDEVKAIETWIGASGASIVGNIPSGSKKGNGTKIQMFGSGTPATNDCAKFDANGNIVGAGAACGGGGGGSGTVTNTGSLSTGNIVIGNSGNDVTESNCAITGGSLGDLACTGSIGTGSGGSTDGAIDLTNFASGFLGTVTVGTLTADRTYTLDVDASGSVAITTGSKSTGNCAKFDASGRIIDAGAPCGAGGGSATIDYGAIGSLPAAGSGNNGNAYLTSDSGYLFVGASSIWNGFYLPWIGTPPPTSSWSADNAASSDTTYGYPYLSVANAGSAQIGAYYRTAPATPYTVTALITHDFSGMVPGTRTGTVSGGGLVFRDSSGKYILFGPYSDSAGNGLWVAKFTSATSLSANYSFQNNTVNSPDVYYRNPQWLQITDDGTNLIFRWSIDGRHWKQFDTRARTNFLASGPDAIGIAGFVQNASVEIAAVGWSVQ